MDRGLTFGDCVAVFGKDDSNPYVAAAREQVEEGVLELDDTTVVSESDDGGAYVLMWKWIDNPEGDSDV